MRYVGNAERRNLRKRHRRIGKHGAMRRILVAFLVRPWRVDGDHPVRPAPGIGGGSRRRSADCLAIFTRLNGPSTRPVRSMSASSFANLSGSSLAAARTALAWR